MLAELHNVLYVLHYPYKLDRCRFTEKKVVSGSKTHHAEFGKAKHK